MRKKICQDNFSVLKKLTSKMYKSCAKLFNNEIQHRGSLHTSLSYSQEKEQN